VLMGVPVQTLTQRGCTERPRQQLVPGVSASSTKEPTKTKLVAHSLPDTPRTPGAEQQVDGLVLRCAIMCATMQCAI